MRRSLAAQLRARSEQQYTKNQPEERSPATAWSASRRRCHGREMRTLGNRIGRLLVGTIVQFLCEQQGASATIVAIALPGLIGFGALGAETGVWFAIKLQTQSAADAAAISAAYEVIAGKTDPTGALMMAASTAAARNGFKGTAPTLIFPYSDGIASGGVAVTLQQKQEALLAAMFLPAVTVASRAVAVIEVLDNPCLLALATSGTAVEVGDAAQLYMPGCSAAANSISGSAIDLQAVTSSINAATLVTVGTVSLQGNPIDPAAPPPEFTLASPARIGAPAITDPFATTLTHAFLINTMPTAVKCNWARSARARIYDGKCVVAGKSLTHARIRLSAETQISGPWTILAGQTIDLTPGTYWVTGDLRVEATGVVKCSACNNAEGTGVTVILATQGKKIGTVSMASSAQVALNAPNTGRFSGLVLAQDANGLPNGTTYSSTSSTIAGAPGVVLNGLVYFPNSSMTFTGGPSDSGPRCLLLVVKTLTVNGASSLEAGGCASAGLNDLPAVHTVALAE